MPEVPLVQVVGQESTESTVVKVTVGRKALLELTAGTAEMANQAPRALLAPVGRLASPVPVALRDFQAPRATKVAQELKVTRATTACLVQGDILASVAPKVNPVVPAKTALMAGTARTVLPFPFASP